MKLPKCLSGLSTLILFGDCWNLWPQGISMFASLPICHLFNSWLSTVWEFSPLVNFYLVFFVCLFSLFRQVRERLKQQVVEMKEKFPGFRPGLAILQVLFSLMTTTENLCCFVMVSAQLIELYQSCLAMVTLYKEQKSRVPCGMVTQFCDIFSPSTGAQKHF